MVNNYEIKEYKNKYRLVAEQIYTSLGVGNYSNAYNCMTRFRTNVTDKSLVAIDAIKKIPLVKGINWNGSELQIIIGGEVVKVVDEFKKYENEILQTKITNDNKSVSDLVQVRLSVGQRIMSAIVGIMQPAIAIVVAGGMLMAIYSLLTLPDASVLKTSVPNPLWSSGTDLPETIAIDMGTLYLFDIWSALFFVLSKVMLSSIGLFFIYNTARYFKGNKALAITIGLFLMSRAFFPTINPTGLTDLGTPWDEATFGDWTSNMGKSGFLLFKMGDFPVMVMGYEGSIIPYIVGGIVVVYLDKWVRTWMPTTIDITFRVMVVVLLSMFGLWFILAPISSMIEFGLYYAMNWFGAIPYGFGTAIFAFLWQPLVIIGCHTPLGMMIDMQMVAATSGENPNMQVNILLGTANVVPYFGQLGAVIAVGLISKNATLKRTAFGTIPSGILGITEPIIYGVNLPRMKPFLFGCAGAAVGGFLVGILNIGMDLPGTFGLLSILRFNGNDTMSKGVEIGLLVMIWAFTFIVGFGLTIFFYKERKNELAYFKKAINKLITFTHTDKVLVNKEFEAYTKTIKEMHYDYKAINHYYSEISKLEQQMIILEDKESKHRVKLYKELVHLRNKLLKKEEPLLINKFNDLNNKYSKYGLDDEKDAVQCKIDKLKKDDELLLNKIKDTKTEVYNNSVLLANKYENKMNDTQKLTVNNMVYNALNSVEIGFGIEDAKPVRFKKGAKNV